MIQLILLSLLSQSPAGGPSMRLDLCYILPRTDYEVLPSGRYRLLKDLLLPPGCIWEAEYGIELAGHSLIGDRRDPAHIFVGRGEIGIHAIGNNPVSIRNLILHGNQSVGISMYESSPSAMRGSSVSHVHVQGYSVGLMSGLDKVSVQNSTFEAEIGMVFQGRFERGETWRDNANGSKTGSFILNKNKILPSKDGECSVGVLAQGSYRGRMERNSIQGCKTGVHLQDSGFTFLINNLIHDQGAFDEEEVTTGILQENSVATSIQQNEVTARVGIHQQEPGGRHLIVGGNFYNVFRSGTGLLLEVNTPVEPSDPSHPEFVTRIPDLEHAANNHYPYPETLTTTPVHVVSVNSTFPYEHDPLEEEGCHARWAYVSQTIYGPGDWAYNVGNHSAGYLDRADDFLNNQTLVPGSDGVVDSPVQYPGQRTQACDTYWADYHHRLAGNPIPQAGICEEDALERMPPGRQAQLLDRLRDLRQGLEEAGNYHGWGKKIFGPPRNGKLLERDLCGMTRVDTDGFAMDADLIVPGR